MEAKYILYGAGFYGAHALSYYGDENVLCFADGAPDKTGTDYLGKPVIDFERMIIKSKSDEATVVLSLEDYFGVKKKLLAEGINDFEIFSPRKIGGASNPKNACDPRGRRRFYPPSILIFEENRNRAARETEKDAEKQNALSKCVEEAVKSDSLFEYVEIETINRCNGLCSFCPVNARSDTREYALMEESLFERVVSQLRELDYSGFLSLFSNNEPLLDDRIAAFCKYAREMLPKAYLHLWTNGTLLSVQKYAEIIECLDELVIDNYSDDMRLIKPVERIANHIGGNKDLIQKTTIVLRKQNQVLTTRGGSAPNRRNEPKPQVGGQTCVYPFKQLIVRPTGEVSLCCNDALGAHTLGDLSRQSVGEVWYGEKYKEIRRLIARGRRNLDPCSGCDVFFLP